MAKKKTSVALSPDVLKDLKRLGKNEGRSVSALIEMGAIRLLKFFGLRR